MVNPRQMSLFDGRHPKSALIAIKEKQELLQLTDMIPWPELIERAQDSKKSLAAGSRRFIQLLTQTDDMSEGPPQITAALGIKLQIF